MNEINLEQYRTHREFSYICEQFLNIIRILATGPGDVRSRLHSAWRLSLCGIRIEDLPEINREDMLWIVKQLHKYKEESPGQMLINKNREVNDPTYKIKYAHLYPDPVEATLKRITNKTGNNIAQRIFNIYDSLVHSKNK